MRSPFFRSADRGVIIRERRVAEQVTQRLVHDATVAGPIVEQLLLRSALHRPFELGDRNTLQPLWSVAGGDM